MDRQSVGDAIERVSAAQTAAGRGGTGPAFRPEGRLWLYLAAAVLVELFQYWVAGMVIAAGWWCSSPGKR